MKRGHFKSYEVATFYYDDIVGKVLCYTRYRSPASPGRQKIYTVVATNGREARAIAKNMRLAEERAK